MYIMSTSLWRSPFISLTVIIGAIGTPFFLSSLDNNVQCMSLNMYYKATIILNNGLLQYGWWCQQAYLNLIQYSNRLCNTVLISCLVSFSFCDVFLYPLHYWPLHYMHQLRHDRFWNGQTESWIGWLDSYSNHQLDWPPPTAIGRNLCVREAYPK